MFQHMDGSSTAWAPSVTALTHLAIVCEALLIESERYQENVHFDNITSTEAHSKTFLLHIFRNNKQQILPTGPCMLCLKPAYYHYYYCFLRREGHGDRVYTHSGSCFVLTLPTPGFFWKSVLGLERAEGFVALFSFEKDCEACVFAVPTAYKPTSAFRETSPLSFHSACFSSHQTNSHFLGHTLHPLTPWNLQ